MIQAAIVGGTGYTGVELLRLLLSHPEVEIAGITSRSETGIRVDALFPSLRGHCDLIFTEPDMDRLGNLDLVFFATPHGVAMEMAGKLLDAGARLVDLSADFRLQDQEVFAKWYDQPHTAPETLAEAVYGLPELFRTEIRNSRIVANPGCYPTAVLLGLAPLLQADLIDRSTLIADCKSGVSGAGRTGKVSLIFPEVGDSVQAYGVSGHRHRPEIEMVLSRIASDPVELQFTPHLMPMIRGIHATLYARLHVPMDNGELQAIYQKAYGDEPFVDVLPFGGHPATRSVRGANLCRIALHQPRPGQIVILSVIDNLVKGAAGQAVQNMNVMHGFPETLGIGQIAVLP